MRIEIEISKEFEEHFKQDKFEDTLHRLSADAHLIAGKYEKETAIMLIKAFKESKPAYNVDKAVAELEKEKEIHTNNYNISIYKEFPEIKQRYKQICGVLDKAIDIVRKGGIDENSNRFFKKR